MKFYVIVVLLLLTRCTTDTNVYVSEFDRKYENGKTIAVLREDRITKWKGIISGINYNNTSSFSYSFILQPGELKWEGGVDEVPRSLLFCNENILLKVTEQIIKYDSLYGPPRFKDTTYYFKNVDDRYFFKLLGSQYFISADSAEYQESVDRCEEVPVPYL